MQSGLGKFVRQIGQGIDRAGKLFELHPHEDKCMLYMPLVIYFFFLPSHFPLLKY